MPEWASRIKLIVKDVRVERLQDISEADSIAGGAQKEELVYNEDDPVNPPGSYGYVSGLHPFPYGKIHVNPQEAFAEIWDFRNGSKPGCSWKDNPWVWRVGFEVKNG
jgi:hypothetical protein